MVTIIAEIGSVHDGSFGNAQKLIEMCAKNGADAAKFQTHISAAETTRNAPMPSYFKGEPRYEYFERTGFTLEKWRALKAQCDENGVEFISSPFSIEAVELLEQVGVARYKIGSGEMTNIPMLKAVAETGKPVILSSGMSSWAELDEAVAAITSRHRDVTVLQCTSEYPCKYEQVGLNVMQEMQARYNLPVGLSDHTLTPWAAVMAVTLGATVIEKHVAFSRLMYGSDARHSVEPDELRALVDGIRAVEIMRASPVDKDAKVQAANIRQMKDIFEKSVVSVGAIAAGSVFTLANVAVKKPGSGIPAREFERVLGRRAARDIADDALLESSDIEGWES